MSNRVEALRHCRVLEGFSDIGLQILAAVGRDRVYPNAQPLQVQGEAPRDPGSLVFIVSGRVRCEVSDLNGQKLGLGTLQPGDHLGGLRLLGSEAPSPLTAVAEGEVHAIVIDRTGLERLRRHKPQTAAKLMTVLAEDFGESMSQNALLFSEFAHFAASRVNRSERTYTTYTDMQPLELTPYKQD